MSVKAKIIKRLGSFTLDVEFEAGNEVLALLGGSGCGKSMTLRCIAGIVTPDEGHIEVNGEVFFDSKKRVNMTPQQRSTGLLFQNYALFPNMTTKENIMTVLRRRAGSKGNAEERYEAVAAKFFLTGLEDHYPRQLSGGQQQRAALARIMASGPAIIMLDEPLSALDSFLRWKLEQRLSNLLSEFSGTTLFVSHNRDEVYRLCEKVCVINEGRSEKVRNVKDFFHSPPTIAAAILSGCKNFSRAKPAGGGRIAAVDWGAVFECDREIPHGTGYIGVRAHYWKVLREPSDNAVAAVIREIHEEVFSSVISCVVRGGNGGSFTLIRAEMPKATAAGFHAGEEVYLRVEPHDIMPLLDSA